MSDLNDIPWKVYGLIDPRTGEVFYVGMSYIVKSRVKAHNTDKNGSAYERCQEIIKAGLKPDYCIFGTFEDSSAAAGLEETLIIAIPGLCNRTNDYERRQFWRNFPNVVQEIDRRQAEQRAKQ